MKKKVFLASLIGLMSLLGLVGTSARAQGCGAVTSPWWADLSYESYNAGTGFLCWTQGGDLTWGFTETYGGGAVRAYANGAEDHREGWLLSQPITLDVDSTGMKLFWCEQNGGVTLPDSVKMWLMVLVTTEDSLDLANCDTIYSAFCSQVSYTPRSVSLAAYAGQTIRLAFHVRNLSLRYRYAYFSDISVRSEWMPLGNMSQTDTVIATGDTVTFSLNLSQGDIAATTYTWHSTLLDSTWVNNGQNDPSGLVYGAPGVDTVSVTAANPWGTLALNTTVKVRVCNDTVFPFLETFDDGGLICWQPLEGSNWQLIQPGTGSGNGPNKSMVSSSEYANVDSWIVSKAIHVPSDTMEHVVLSWDVSATHYVAYYYRYFVLVSTGDWTDRSTYDTVYADSSRQVYCGNENTTFASRQVSLAAYAGQTIHVAFCNHPLYANPYEGHWMRLNIDNVEVRSSNAPVVALNVPTQVYSGDSITFTATLIEGNTTGMTYTWYSSLLNDTVTLNTNQITLNYSQIGIDTLTVVVTNAYGSDTASAVVTVVAHPLPQVALAAPGAVHCDDTVSYVANLNGCSPQGLTCTWHSSLTGITYVDSSHSIFNSQLSIVYAISGIDTLRVIVSNNDGADTAEAVVTVRNCNSMYLPYVEDFEGVTAVLSSADGYLPECWTSTWNGSNAAFAPHVISTGGYQYINDIPGQALLMLAGSSSGYGDKAEVVLPRFSQPAHNLFIAFDYRFENVYMGTLSVGYYGIADTFVTVTTMTPHGGNYLRDTVTLASVPDSNARIALRWTCGSAWFGVAIDNIEVFSFSTSSMAPRVALYGPSSALSHDTTSFSAFLIWGDTAGLTYTWHSTLLDTSYHIPHTSNVNLIYPTMGVDTLTVTATNAYGSNTATLIVQVNSNCNYTSVPYYEDFEAVPHRIGNTGGFLPNCWSRHFSGAAYNAPYAVEYGYSSEDDMTLNMIAGSGSTYGDGVAIVVLPGFEYPLEQLSLAVDYYNDSYYGTLSVGYMVDTVFTPLHTLSRNTSGYYTMSRDTISFSGVTVPGAQMAIRFLNPNLWEQVYLDNFEVFLTGNPGMLPVAAIYGPSQVNALDDTVTYTAALTSGDTTGLTYTWHSTLLDTSYLLPPTSYLSLVYPHAGVDTVSVIATTSFGVDTAIRVVTVSWPERLLPLVSMAADSIHYTCDGRATYTAHLLRGDTTGLTYTWHSTLLDTSCLISHSSNFNLIYPYGGIDTIMVLAVNIYGSSMACRVVEVHDCHPVTDFPYVATPGIDTIERYCWKIWSFDTVRNPNDPGYDPGLWRSGIDYYFHSNQYPCMISTVGNWGSYGGNVAFFPDDWLVSPLIELPANATGITLQWSGVVSETTMRLLCSTSGRSSASLFSDTLYTETHANYPYAVWTTHTLSLDAYAGQTISLAFVHCGPVGYYSDARVAMDSLIITFDTLPTPPPTDTVWHIVSVTANVDGVCETYGSGRYMESETVEIGYRLLDTASVGGHWQYLGWSDGETGNPRQIVLTSDTILTALFLWIADSVGIEEISIINYQFSIYPNPSHGDVTISRQDVGGSAEVTVLDLTGRVVIPPTPINPSSLILHTSDLPTGTYFVRVTAGNNTTIEKLIINK